MRTGSYDECMGIRKSCHLVEQIGDDFFCDCHEGIKARMCKHSVGLLYKTEKLEISSDVRSKEIGKKRKRGRPKKLPACLSHSSEPVQAEEPIAKSTYHQPAVSLKPQYQSPPVYTAPTPVHHQEAAYSPPAPKYQASVVTSKSISHEPAVSLKPQYHGEAEPEVNPNPSIILKGNSDVSFLSPLIHASHHQERFTHKSSSKMLGKVLEEFKNRSVLSLMGGGFKVSGPYYVVTPEPETERHSYHGSVSFPQ